jgi:anaerobic magnesium-protoporphyrin IX monomethyl ester cyclase
MRVLLIDPPFKRFTGFVSFYFPVGLAYLAAAAREKGHEVTIFDADAVVKGTDIDFSDEYGRLELYRQGLNNPSHAVWSEIEQVLGQCDPDVVGVTAMTTKFGSVLRTVDLVKRYNRDTPVVVGGPHATLLPDQVLKSQSIDFVARGEGEATFCSLLRALETAGDLQSIEGLSFRRNGEVHHNPLRAFVADLDQAPFPARDLLMDQKNYSSEDMGVVMASRGCPFNCSYCCHVWGRKVRFRSVNSIVEEIKLVRSRHGTTQFEFKDDSFTVDRKRTVQLCDRIVAEGLGINWGCSTRVNLLDEELVEKMKAAGCNAVKLGIETGSERILKETDKGVTFAQMRKAASLLNKHGLFWSGYFMMGLPMETEEDIRRTYAFMKELNPYYAGLGVYNPFPKTTLFDQGVRMGLLHEDVELEHFFTRNPKDYYFVDPSRRVATIDGTTFNDLAGSMMAAFHKHNTQMKNIIRRGWARRNAYKSDFRLLVGDAAKAIKWRFSGNRK